MVVAPRHPPRPLRERLPRAGPPWLESQPYYYLVTIEGSFERLYLLSRTAFDLTRPNTLHFYGLPVLSRFRQGHPAFP